MPISPIDHRRDGKDGSLKIIYVLFFYRHLRHFLHRLVYTRSGLFPPILATDLVEWTKYDNSWTKLGAGHGHNQRAQAQDGSVAYRARVRVMQDGVTYHETETFDRRPAAAARISKRERELSKPGAVAKSKNDDPTTLAKVIDRYTEETIKDIGRTKARVLAAIKKYDIVEFLQSLTAKPQTVGNCASHLGAIFAIGRPMWGYRLDEQEMKDAVKVARRMGIITRSAQRDRRPTLDELNRLISHFIERRKKAPQAMPTHKVIAFALFSTRRQEEITRIRWKDFQREHKRVLVRDMKHPGEKIGNDTWVDLPDQARSSEACQRTSQTSSPTQPTPSRRISREPESCWTSMISAFTTCATRAFQGCSRWAGTSRMWLRSAGIDHGLASSDIRTFASRAINMRAGTAFSWSSTPNR